MDIGCGLGTFLSYLSFHINKKKLLGIDDFSQINKEEVKKYQHLVGTNIEIKNKFKDINNKIEYLIIAGISPLKFEESIFLKLKPEQILLDSKHTFDFMQYIPKTMEITNIKFNAIFSIISISYLN